MRAGQSRIAERRVSAFTTESRLKASNAKSREKEFRGQAFGLGWRKFYA
jgi:hypothetical protein